MKIRYLVCMAYLLCITGISADAQIRRSIFEMLEFYTGGGSTFYFGEIGGKDSHLTGVRAIIDYPDIDLWQTRVIATTGIRYSQFKNFAASFELNPMVISGNDLRSDKAALHNPPYSFTTFITEAVARVEIFISNRKTTDSPYLFIGAGGMAFSGKQISDWEFCRSYVFGIGQRFPFKIRKAHSIELAYHFTGGKNADNLDGYAKIKQGGRNDLLFTVTYKINLEIAKQSKH